jgi:ribonuclease HI
MITIFTDGASKGNPGPGGWGAIIIQNSKFKIQNEVIEIGGREETTTNNRMELTAALEALEYVTQFEKPITLYTDSSYVLRGITQWVHAWQKNNWMTKNNQQVSNVDLWQKLFSVTEKLSVTWKLLPGHAGVPGNERADEIASTFAEGARPLLFSGSLENYSVDVTQLHSSEGEHKRTENKTRSKAKAYCYLSLVDGEVKRHETWAECEARVKGKKAKFRKALSEEDSQNILRDWGVSE